jgi:hypothetical protein
MHNAVDNPVIQRNIHTIRACLDAHNRQDMKAFDFYAEDIEIIEMPTGVTYKGMGKMRELPEWRTAARAATELTDVIATEAEACVEICREGRHDTASHPGAERAVGMESIYRRRNQAPRPSRSQSAQFDSCSKSNAVKLGSVVMERQPNTVKSAPRLWSTFLA